MTVAAVYLQVSPKLYRDDVACGITELFVKRKKTTAEDALFPPPPSGSGTCQGVSHVLFSSRLMANSLVRAYINLYTNPTPSRNSKRKERVRSGKRARYFCSSAQLHRRDIFVRGVLHFLAWRRRASTSSDLIIRTFRGSRLALDRSYGSRVKRLKLIHPTRIRRSISVERFAVSVTAPSK